ncbi:MAG: MOSC domain-containing protein [Pseudomonadales bacterium]
MVTISELTIYPVKSCAGVSVDSVALDRFGPENDRRWLVVDEAGVQITQRELPVMALIQPSITASGLQFKYRDQQIDVSTPHQGAPRAVQVWADRVQALDAGTVASEFFSSVLQCSARLMWMPDTTERKVDPHYAQHGETVSFADGFPLLLISQASLDDLNTRLDQPVPMNRFRPNVVVQGCEAYAEDSWSTLISDQLEFQIAKPCSRCVMPSINQRTSEKDSHILRALASYRRGSDGRIYFGQNLLYQMNGQLSVGDTFAAQ